MLLMKNIILKPCKLNILWRIRNWWCKISTSRPMFPCHAVHWKKIFLSPQALELTAVNECILLDNIEIFEKNGFDFIIDQDGLFFFSNFKGFCLCVHWCLTLFLLYVISSTYETSKTCCQANQPQLGVWKRGYWWIAVHASGRDSRREAWTLLLYPKLYGNECLIYCELRTLPTPCAVRHVCERCLLRERAANQSWLAQH